MTEDDATRIVRQILARRSSQAFDCRSGGHAGADVRIPKAELGDIETLLPASAVRAGKGRDGQSWLSSSALGCNAMRDGGP